MKPATPYVMIRSWPDDLGLRPVAEEDASSVYFSPDIGIGIHAPIIEVWVNNGGLAVAAPVRVELFRGSPSLTYPAPDLTLVGTEHTVVGPQSSARLLFDLRPFPHSVIGSIVARCSTPFDTCSYSLDPREDRHVAMQNLAAPDPEDPEGPTRVDIRLPNWYTQNTSSAVEMTITRVRIAPTYVRLSAGAAATRLHTDLLRFGEAPPDGERHLESLRMRRAIPARLGRRIRSALRARTPYGDHASGLSHSRVSPLRNQAKVTVEIEPEARRLHPTTESIRLRNELPCRGGAAAALSRLPPNRQRLIDDLELGPLEEREIGVTIEPLDTLESDERLVVHLFHVDRKRQSVEGRFSVILSPRRTTKG